MSYIHEALKKAQRERELLPKKSGVAWSTRRSERRIHRREWVVSTCFLIIGAAFLSYSWFRSPQQPSSQVQEQPPAVQPAPKSVETPDPAKPLPAAATKPAPMGPPASSATEAMANVAIAAGKKDEKSQAPEAPPQTPETNPEVGKADALYQQALALHKAGRIEEGKKLYEAALEHSPDLVSALNNLGTIYIKEKDYPAAGRMFQRAIRADPTYVDPYYNLACLYALQEDVSRSLFYLKKAISVNQAARDWAETDKDLENLHGQSEYERIIKGA